MNGYECFSLFLIWIYFLSVTIGLVIVLNWVGKLILHAIRLLQLVQKRRFR